MDITKEHIGKTLLVRFWFDHVETKYVGFIRRERHNEVARVLSDPFEATIQNVSDCGKYVKVSDKWSQMSKYQAIQTLD